VHALVHSEGKYAMDRVGDIGAALLAVSMACITALVAVWAVAG